MIGVAASFVGIPFVQGEGARSLLSLYRLLRGGVRCPFVDIPFVQGEGERNPFVYIPVVQESGTSPLSLYRLLRSIGGSDHVVYSVCSG